MGKSDLKMKFLVSVIIVVNGILLTEGILVNDKDKVGDPSVPPVDNSVCESWNEGEVRVDNNIIDIGTDNKKTNNVADNGQRKALISDEFTEVEAAEVIQKITDYYSLPDVPENKDKKLHAIYSGLWKMLEHKMLGDFISVIEPMVKCLLDSMVVIERLEKENKNYIQQAAGPIKPQGKILKNKSVKKDLNANFGENFVLMDANSANTDGNEFLYETLNSEEPAQPQGRTKNQDIDQLYAEIFALLNSEKLWFFIKTEQEIYGIHVDETDNIKFNSI